MNRKDIQAGKQYAVKLNSGMKTQQRPEDYHEYEVVNAKVIKVHEKDPNSDSVPRRFGEKNKVVEIEVIEDWQNGEYAPCRWSQSERTRFVPTRRVLCLFEEYTAGRKAWAAQQARWEQEKQERAAAARAQAEEMADLCKTLDLSVQGWSRREPLFKVTVYADNSFGFNFNGDADDALALLKRLAKAEGVEVSS